MRKIRENHFSRLLYEERLQHHWSQKEVAQRIGTTPNTVSRWELGLNMPSLYFRAQLCTIFGKSAQELGLLAEQAYQEQLLLASPSPDSPIVTLSTADYTASLQGIPFPRNPLFIGRDALLESLDTLLNNQKLAALTQSYALHGLGGVGKTQIALEYVYRHASAYTALLWISAETPESMLASLISLAEVLDLPEQHEQDQHRVVQAVKHWLGKHHGWLLVCDNVEDLSMLRPLLPLAQHGSLLLTTRLQAVGTLAQPLSVEPMNAEEGMLFLLQRAKRLQPGIDLTQIAHQDVSAAQAIVEEMGGLPLALDQAGAYIEETQCSLDGYLQRFRKHRSHLLARRGSTCQDHPASVQTTLSLSLHQAQQRYSIATDVLQFCAFLDPDAIPEALLMEAFVSDEEHKQPFDYESWLLDETTAALGTYSLVQRDSATQNLSLHRLVQVVLQESLSEQECEVWIKRVIATLNRVLPKVEHRSWRQYEQLVPHILQCVKYTTCWKQAHEGLATLLLNTGSYLLERSRYTEAEPLLRRSLKIREEILGSNHPDVATVLHTLGICCYLTHTRDGLAQTALCFQRALHIREQKLGPSHPSLIKLLRNLATLSISQSNHREAEQFYQRALFIAEQTLEHQETVAVLSSFAGFYIQEARYEEAKKLLQQSLQIHEQFLMDDQISLLASLTNLGVNHMAQGNYEEAERFFQRALQLWEQTMGPDHPKVAIPLVNLADLFSKKKKWKKAERLYQRALQLWEQGLGLEHLNVAYALYGLAELNREQGRYTLAEPLYMHALQIRERTLESNHPQVAEIFMGLGRLYTAQENYEQGTSLLRRALEIKKHTLVPTHPDVAESQFALAYCALCQQDFAGAQHYYGQALAIWERTLGLDHPHVLELIKSYKHLQDKHAPR